MQVAANIEKRGAKGVYVKADLTNVSDAENVRLCPLCHRSVSPVCLSAACLGVCLGWQFIAKADAAFGRIDGLVNSAAVSTRGEWGEVTEALIDRCVATNTHSCARVRLSVDGGTE